MRSLELVCNQLDLVQLYAVLDNCHDLDELRGEVMYALFRLAVSADKAVHMVLFFSRFRKNSFFFYNCFWIRFYSFFFNIVVLLFSFGFVFIFTCFSSGYYFCF